MKYAPWQVDGYTLSGAWGSATAHPQRLTGSLAPRYNQLTAVILASPVPARMLWGTKATLFLRANGAQAKLFTGYVQSARALYDDQSLGDVYVEMDGAELTADLDVVDTPRVADDEVTWATVYNADGRPNRHPSTDTIWYGSGARYWTYGAALKHLRTFLVRSDWTLTDAQIEAQARLAVRMPTLDPRGERVLQVIADLASRAGVRLAFRYGGAADVTPVLFDESGNGELTVHFRPETPQPTTLLYLTAGGDSRETAPTMHVVSGPWLHETLYTNDPNAGGRLLTGAPSAALEYAVEYQVDTSQYTTRQFPEIAPGNRPWPLLRQTVSRRSEAGTYRTAAQHTADPESGERVPVGETLALYDDRSTGTWRQILAGAELLYEPSAAGAVLRIGAVLTCRSLSSGSEEGEMQIGLEELTGDTAGYPIVRFTAAAQLPTARIGTAEQSGGRDLQRDAITNAERWSPETRYASVLPGAFANDYETVAAAAREMYLSVDTQLTEVATGAWYQRRETPSFIEAKLGRWAQELPLGALLVIDNPPPDVIGDEVITGYSWEFQELTVSFEASNAISLEEAEARWRRYARVRSLVREIRRSRYA